MAGLEKIVTDELVSGIADRLAAEGRKVTNRLVWDHIGGGSMTTIAGALRRWRERQQIAAEIPAIRVPLPETVAETMRVAVEQLWTAAQEETQKEIDRLSEAANARVADAVAERDGALAELQVTVEELQSLQGRAAGLETGLQAVRQEGEGLRGELASATEKAGQAAARAVEIERRADDLQTELGRVHDDARAERERLADALTQAGVERDEARREAAGARENAARLQGQVEAMMAQQAELMKAIAGKAERMPSGRAPK